MTKRAALKRIGIAAVATVLLVGAKTWLEHTSGGQWFELETYKFLQRLLSPFSGDSRLAVLVVDISRIPGRSEEAPTPRDTLRDLIAAMADQAPRAIAIDVDFSPTGKGWLTDADPEFFDFCLRVREEKNVPIFLAVYRTRAGAPNTWLGIEKYQSLAVAGLALGENTSRVPRWIEADRSPAPLPTLGYALASAYRRPLPEPPPWMAWAIEMTGPGEHGVARELTNELRIAETLVNYSKLEQIKNETIVATMPVSVRDQGAMFRDKMVVLGDATQFMDSFIVPGRAKPVAGVYVLASAAFTLAMEPLYELKHWVRLSLDFAITAVIVLGVEWIRSRRSQPADVLRRRQGRFIVGVVVAVFGVGIVLVRWLGVLWLDFLLVIAALLLHPWVESRLHHRFGRINLGKHESA